MEGRDIGSAVFPETPYKFYIDASPDVRAMRRAKQGLQDSISTRDKIDSTRRTSPLIIAEDAHVIDSSNLTVEGVVGEIFGRLKQKGLPLRGSLANEQGAAITQPWAPGISSAISFRRSSPEETLFDFRVVHPERIIEEGGVILAMNHQSYLDPPLAGIACRREIHYLARKTFARLADSRSHFSQAPGHPGEPGARRHERAQNGDQAHPRRGMHGRLSRGRAHARRPAPAGATGARPNDRQDARSRRADAHLRRLRSIPAWRKAASFPAHHAHHGRADLLYRSDRRAAKVAISTSD